MDDNTSLVNDDELNQMIENLKGKTVSPPTIASSSGAPIQASNPAVPVPTSPVPAGAMADPVAQPTPQIEQPVQKVAPIQPAAPAPILPNDAVPATTSLDSIKQDALSELRPLVDKLNLSPDDKFNTLLLIIRSTDDASLLPAAHMAARQIADEGRRAQALLDVIKEIDFFKQSAK